MHSPDAPELEIIESWHANAMPWARAVRAGSMASRRLVTNDAILEAVLGTAPRRVLDVGCGEGWLARALHARGVSVVGIDAIAALVADAASRGGGEFHTCRYEELAARRFDRAGCDAADIGAAGVSDAAGFDTAVCNFSLLGRESVESLLDAAPKHLRAHGRLIIQTLHPLAVGGDAPYEDGWRAGSWCGAGDGFGAPAPWYFRTLASWYELLRRHRFALIELREPRAQSAAAPASIIFICGCEPRVVFE